MYIRLTHAHHRSYIQLKILIIRDYHTEFWLSPKISSRDPIISPTALVPGLIMVDG